MKVFIIPISRLHRTLTTLFFLRNLVTMEASRFDNHDNSHAIGGPCRA